MSKSRDAFRTISEVADWLDTPAHVLRFWESKFPQIKPVKRAGGRRYYRPEDMALLGGIKTLLHEDGLTIKGAQKVLRDRGVRHVSALGPSPLDGEDGDIAPIEGEASDPVEKAAPAAPVQTPDVTPTAPETPRDRSLPAFLRRAPDMGAPRPGGAATEAQPATGETSEDDPSTSAPPDEPQNVTAPTDRIATPEAPPGPAPVRDPAAAPRPVPAPQRAIPETADLLSARHRDAAEDQKDPRVIHETHDPGTEWQPELPFGTLRPAPKPAKRSARPVAAPAPAEPEAVPRPGLLSLLAEAEPLAAEPARLAAALTRLEALRDRLRP